ncbi:MAG: cation diffusion facilitator family transporter [Burkholderiaceae bacterium]
MSESRKVVYAALAGNVAIAVTKFVVAGVTGSSAMLSEGIHSTVDTGNSLLLLVGVRGSQRQADQEHPFGYGKELYFSSLIVAILIFGFGGGISAYEGVTHILNPHPIENPGWTYIVLACSALFEGISFSVALRAALKEKGERPFWSWLHHSKDPGTFTVLAEDSAALAGLALAAIGIWCSQHFQMPAFDGLASVAIGILLAGVAVSLIYESRGLLIGEGVSPQTAASIRQMVAADDRVVRASSPLSMYFGPDDVLLTLDVEFRADLPGTGIAQAVKHFEEEIRARYPKIKRIYIEAVPPAAPAVPAAGRPK